MMRRLKLLRYLFTMLFFCSFFSCSKQDDIELLFEKVENILEQQPDSALSILNSILFPEDLTESRYNKFVLLQIQAKDKSCRDITSDSIIFSVRDYYLKKKDFPNAALATFYCGCIFHEQKNVKKATSAYLKAEMYADYTSDDNLKGLIQSNLATLFYEQFLTQEAIKRGENAAVLYDKAKNYKNEINTLLLIGNCFLMENENDSAFRYYNQSLKLAEDYKMLAEQISIKQNMGIAYQEIGYYMNAKKSLYEALSISTEEDEAVKAKILINLANIYKLENKIDSAKFHVEQSLFLQHEDKTSLQTTYLLLSEIEEQNGNLEKALLYFKDYNELIEKRIDDNESRIVLELQEKYNFETLKNKHNRQVIYQLNTIILLSLVFILAVFVAIFYYRKYIRKKNEILEAEQKIESLKKMAHDYSKNGNSFRDILIQHFDILKKAMFIDIDISEQDKKNGERLIKKFNQIVYGGNSLDWNKLYQTMNELKNGLYNWIRDQYPQLDESEFCICCLSCEDFSSTEIAIITKLTINTVQKKRSIIRRKIGITYHGSFLDFFSKKFSAK